MNMSRFCQYMVVVQKLKKNTFIKFSSFKSYNSIINLIYFYFIIYLLVKIGLKWPPWTFTALSQKIDLNLLILWNQYIF